MKSRAIESEKRNMFGIIKDIFGNFGSAIKSLVSTEIDEPGETKDPVLESNVQNIQNTRFSDDDVVEVTAGGKAKFGGISGYRANVNVAKAVEEHNARVNAAKAEKVNEPKEKGGEARFRGERG